jgi:putative FmdB family regulatory protein
MPIYEFRCEACGNVQEIIVSSTSTELEMKCGECQGEDLVRIMSCANFSTGSSSSSSGAAASGGGCTHRTCGPGSSCSTVTLPGHTRD